ncbi:MAG TPA: hypothetical protein VIV12_09090, partial [Streptosporangiaceae bacterium]
GPRGLLLAALLLLLPAYTSPLWNLTMFAPQYQEGLRLDIYSYHLEGGNRGQDIKEINVLNHYIGMRDLTTADFTEAIQMRDRNVVLGPREFFVVPRGIEHCPRADTETAVLLFEPGTVINTGDAGGELTAEVEELA